MPFKTYEVQGYPLPLRLSEEQAKAHGGVEVGAPDPNRPKKSAGNGLPSSIMSAERMAAWS